MKLENKYFDLSQKFYERGEAVDFTSSDLLIFNEELAHEIELDLNQEDIKSYLLGQKREYYDPVALAYAGHQFGHFVPSLGDGRALLLGQSKTGHDIQLKGCGQTMFSRRGDGRSALGPVLREYILSESMNNLGVPTTRALGAFTTGENVYRQFGEEPGGVFVRVATSHIRVGTFQYFASQADMESVEKLLNFSISIHYPHLKDLDIKEKCIEFLKSVGQAQAELIGKWTSLGFIHGVMNTDNYSVGGITIDYGPCAFMDEFRFKKVFSSIDQQGRYSFFNQVAIGQWNLLRLADCLLPLINSDIEKAVVEVESEIEEVMKLFVEERIKSLGQKFGLKKVELTDEKMIMDFLKYLEEEGLDFTISFRNLESLLKDDDHLFPNSKRIEHVKAWWRPIREDIDLLELDKVNPFVIPRNHQVQEVIDLAYEGDFSKFFQMIDALKNPYLETEISRPYSIAPKVEQRVHATFCGT